MIILIILMINSLFILSSQNFHHEQNQQRVSDAKIGRLQPPPASCAPCRRSRRESVRKLFFLLFFGASACTISSWLPRSEPKRDRFGDLCEKKRKKRKEEKFYSTKRKCSHPCSGCVYFAMQQCADVGE